jgi:hypothetical protein
LSQTDEWLKVDVAKETKSKQEQQPLYSLMQVSKGGTSSSSLGSFQST